MKKETKELVEAARKLIDKEAEDMADKIDKWIEEPPKKKKFRLFKFW